MLDGEKYPYEIIRRNFRDSRFVTVDIVKGLSMAERTVERLDRGLTVEEREAGWGHFHQRTTKKPWTLTDRTTRRYLKPTAFRK